MALTKVSEILKMADEANTSVIAFNCIDYCEVRAVCEVAEELNKPVLIALRGQPRQGSGRAPSGPLQRL